MKLDIPWKRVERSKERLASFWDDDRLDRVPFMVLLYTLPYSTYRVSDNELLHNPKKLFELHIDRLHVQLKIEDDFIPCVFYADRGNVVMPSAFGCEIIWPQYHGQICNQIPHVKKPILQNQEDIDRLQVPDPYYDGLMPLLLEFVDFVRRKTNDQLTVGVNDGMLGGPFNVAFRLRGLARFMRDMYETPDLANKLLKICTETVIRFTKVLKEHVGDDMDANTGIDLVWIPKGKGGIAIADDEAVIFSPRLYREFAVPYNSRILDSFGGGFIHCCGDATHNFDAILRISSLKAYHEDFMGKTATFKGVKEKVKRKIPIIGASVCPELKHISWFKNAVETARTDKASLLQLSCLEDCVTTPEGGYIIRKVDASTSLQQAKKIARFIKKHGRYY